LFCFCIVIDQAESNNCSEENKEAIVETLSTMGDFFGGEKQTMALLPKLPAKHTAIGTQRYFSAVFVECDIASILLEML
jgi:hypothetical protein